MEWSPSGDPIAVTTGQGLLLLDPEDISEASLLETEKPLRALAFHPNGDRLATADQGVNVFIYDSSSGDRLETLAPSINGAHALFYNRRGNLVIAVHGGPADYVGIGSYGDDTAFGFSAIPNATRDNPLALHPTDNQVAVYIFGQIEIWDQPEEPTKTFEAPFAADLEFRPDGSLLAAPHRDCKLRLWDPETGEVIRTFDWCESPDESMGIVDFSSDGRLLAVADGQGTILVWDIDKEQTHQEIKLASGRVLGLAFDPTGDRLASLHEDGLLQIWAIEP